MKVLIIHNDYQQAGGERAAVLAQIGLFDDKKQDYCVYQRNNDEIKSYRLGQKVRFFAQTIYSSRSTAEIKELVEKQRPDVAHVHNIFPLISPAIYRTLNGLGVPIVQTLHNFRFLCPNGLFYTRGEICERCKLGDTSSAVRLKCYHGSYLLSGLYAVTIGLHRRLGTFNYIDRYIALTEFTALKFVEGRIAGPEKMTVLGNFLPSLIHGFSPADAPRPYLLYLGRLSPEKGVSTLISAMSGCSDIDLVVAGDGPQKAELENLARQVGGGRVSFVGVVSGEKKWSLLRGATATVIPSVGYDNFPVVFLESISTGTPVIATRLGSFPYLIADQKDGLLFPPGDTSALREKIGWVMTHRDQVHALGLEAQKLVLQKYSPDYHYDRLIDIYTAAIEDHRS